MKSLWKLINDIAYPLRNISIVIDINSYFIDLFLLEFAGDPVG